MRAIFPLRENWSGMLILFAPLTQIGGRDVVHVVKREVFAPHRPDEGITGGAAAGMDRPARTDDRLLVLHHDVACLPPLSHQVEHHAALWNAEISVDFHAALVGMGRHGVPDVARLELREPHGKLAGFEHVGVDELVDCSGVRRRGGACRTLICVRDGDEGRFVCLVRGRGHHVKLRGLIRAAAGKHNVPCTLGYVQAILKAQFVCHAVRCDGAGAADVEDAKLTPLEEIRCAEALPHVKPLVNGNGASHRQAAERDHPVNMRIDGNNLVGKIQTFNEEFRARFLRGIALEILRADTIANVHINPPPGSMLCAE